MVWRTKLCAQPGCGKVAEQAKDFCSAHQTDNYRSKRDGIRHRERRANCPWSSWYGLAIWRNLKSVFLGSDHGNHVICEHRDPRTGERCHKPTYEVDHKIPHRGNWDLFTDLKNLQGLCRSCHARKTAAEDGGFGNNKYL